MALSPETDRVERVSPRERLRSAFLTGFATTVSLVVTVLVVGFAVNFPSVEDGVQSILSSGVAVEEMDGTAGATVEGE
jgi:uncharacterized membrane protein